MEPVPEVVARAAKAIARSYGCDPEERFFQIRRFRFVPYWTVFIPAATAAIVALRRPTEAMRYAVWYDQYITCGGTPELADFCSKKKLADEKQRQQDISSFGACIDAALTSPSA